MNGYTVALLLSCILGMVGLFTTWHLLIEHRQKTLKYKVDAIRDRLYLLQVDRVFDNNLKVYEGLMDLCDGMQQVTYLNLWDVISAAPVIDKRETESLHRSYEVFYKSILRMPREVQDVYTDLQKVFFESVVENTMGLRTLAQFGQWVFNMAKILSPILFDTESATEIIRSGKINVLKTQRGWLPC